MNISRTTCLLVLLFFWSNTEVRQLSTRTYWIVLNSCQLLLPPERGHKEHSMKLPSPVSLSQGRYVPRIGQRNNFVGDPTGLHSSPYLIACWRRWKGSQVPVKCNEHRIRQTVSNTDVTCSEEYLVHYRGTANHVLVTVTPTAWDSNKREVSFLSEATQD